MTSAIVVIISFLFLCATVAQDSEERIINGQVANSGDFPYVVSIAAGGPVYEHVCGGFIYSDRYIVTAASCVQNFRVTDITVVVGATSLSTPDANEQYLDVLSITIYPEYDSISKLHDIALVKLTKSVVFGPTAQYIYYYEVNLASTSAVTMGWGALNDGGLASINLRFANLTILPDDNCKQIYNETVNPVELYDLRYMICAGSDASNQATCTHDEGGPLVMDSSEGFLAAVGIMSKNKGCNTEAGQLSPSIFTRVFSYYSWLRQIAGQQPTPTTTKAPGK